MTPQRFQEIRGIFESIVSQPSAARPAMLRDVRDRDAELAAEVEALIVAYERQTNFIERPLVPVTDRAHGHVQESASIDPMGPAATPVGPYELLEVIGQGGMGQVWRAEQTEPVRRIVALKLIKAGMDTHEVIRRFESERQALAVMDHPAIAKVYDAGSTSMGRPYFAMEYVAGVPITRYCDEHRLAARDRLKLFVRVCEGIQHAHHKAIIHRDIKPSNILVTEVDGKPLPKIIDFGVARAISADVDQTALTRHGAVLGTPDYMSPEQASIAGGTVDTRTDVYSLGVVLYELLTGGLPYDLRGLPLFEALRRVGEDTVARPSASLRHEATESKAARDRRTALSALIAALRGDLDAIVLKSLEKDPARRYSSPSELAADIGRYLRNEPVWARPPGAWYFATKYVRRHRLSVAAAAAVAVLTVAFGIWQSVQIRRVTTERDRADRIAQFMIDMFQVSDPGESRGKKVTAREILDRASSGIEKGLSNDPELQAKLMTVMGRVYLGLGLYGEGELLLRRSLDSRSHLSGPEHLETANAMSDLANALDSRGRFAEARTLDLKVLAIRSRLLGPDHPDTLKTMNNLAVDMVHEGQYREAGNLQESVYRARLRRFGPEDPRTLRTMENLGDTLSKEGRLREAENIERSALEIRRRKLGPDHPDTLQAIHHLAGTVYDEGRYAEAESLDREALQTRLKVLSPEHRDTLNSMVALANPLENEGRLIEAERLNRQALAIQERILGPEHPDVLLAMNNLAGVLASQGRYAEAEKLDRKVVEIRNRILGPEHPYTLHSCSRLAFVLMQEGSLDEAEQLARKTRDVVVRLFGKDQPEAAAITYTLACIAARKQRQSDALALLREAVDEGLKPNAVLGIPNEPSFKTMHGHPAFRTVVAYAREHVSSLAH